MKNIKILLVEDNASEAYVYEKILKQENINVVHVDTGGKALAELNTDIDLIMMDVNLPDIDGFDLCKKIKLKPKYAGIPILQLSGSYVNMYDKIKGLNYGADNYLNKPVEPPVLIVSIKALLRMKNTESELRQFTYWVTHDLQAPIRAIDRFSDILMENLKDQLDEENHNFLELIKHNSQKMKSLLDALFELVNTDFKTLRYESIFLKKIIEDILSLYKEQLEHFNVVVDVPRNFILRSDRVLVRTIFQNLICNSIKFARSTEIPKIEISIEANNILKISVYDNGIGIEEEALDNIFKPFIKLHAEKKYRGEGIGLAIVKKSIDKLQWDLTVESEEGKFTKMILTIPKGRW